MKPIYVQRRGEPRRVMLTTNVNAEPRVRYRVMRLGAATPFFIAVPYSLMAHTEYQRCVIELGGCTLHLNHRTKTVEGAIPESWFIEL
jgi:hypothetical protein